MNIRNQQLKELVEPTTDYLYTRSESPHKLPWWAIRVQAALQCWSSRGTHGGMTQSCRTCGTAYRTSWVQLTRSMLTSQASDGPEATIPLEVARTTSRPDLVTIQGRSHHMLELTVCGNTCDALVAAHTGKSHEQEYLQLYQMLGRIAGKPNVPPSK